MRRISHIPKKFHRKPRREFGERLQKKEKIQTGLRDKPLEFYQASPLYNCGKKSCPVLRKLNEIKYSGDINRYLNEKGIPQESDINNEIKEIFSKNELTYSQRELRRYGISEHASPLEFDDMVSEETLLELSYL